MEWCGYTVVEATGGSICDSCSGKRPYRISMKKVLKQAWQRHGIDGRGFSLGGHSPPMMRQSLASMRKLSEGNHINSVRSSASSTPSTPRLNFEVALSLEDFSRVVELSEDRLPCSEILCEMKSSSKNQLQSC